MRTVTLTKLGLTTNPGIDQVFWLDWADSETPTTWNTLPNATTDSLGNIIGTYTFTVPNVPIIVRARNQKKCADWYEQEFFICSFVEPEFTINA